MEKVREQTDKHTNTQKNYKETRLLEQRDIDTHRHKLVQRERERTDRQKHTDTSMLAKREQVGEQTV
jgi:hypothetical protein